MSTSGRHVPNALPNFAKLRSYVRVLLRHPTLLLYAIKDPRYDAVKARYEQLQFSKLERRGQLAFSGAGAPFHNDKILQSLIESSINYFKVSSFFETGTFKADSLLYLIHQFQNRLKYVSCEVNDDFFRYASNRLNQDPLVKSMLNHSIFIYNSSSPEAIRGCLEKDDGSQLTLWWLDAHWYSYWPLEDELKEILKFSRRAIILIDDFKMPFYAYSVPAYASYGGRDNDLEYIDEILGLRKNPEKFDVLFPAYRESILPENYIPSYVAIYMNLRDSFDKFASHELNLLRHFIKWRPTELG